LQERLAEVAWLKLCMCCKRAWLKLCMCCKKGVHVALLPHVLPCSTSTPLARLSCY
jgi:hypothetical protein